MAGADRRSASSKKGNTGRGGANPLVNTYYDSLILDACVIEMVIGKDTLGAYERCPGSLMEGDYTATPARLSPALVDKALYKAHILNALNSER